MQTISYSVPYYCYLMVTVALIFSSLEFVKSMKKLLGEPELLMHEHLLSEDRILELEGSRCRRCRNFFTARVWWALI